MQRSTINGSAAIVGLAGLFPGARDLDGLLGVMRKSVSVTTEAPSDRAALLPEADEWAIRAGFLEDVFRFDAAFFGISPKEAKAMDPQQRLLLQVAWQAIENAGYTSDTLPRNTGVFIGVISGDYGTFAEPLASRGEMAARGTDHYQVANRLSYHFDLTGPSVAVDTACSGSGVALHQAMLSLQAGDCEMAIVGGVNLFLHSSRFVQFRQMGIISDDNCCRPFRDGANGTVYGEGISALLLKPADQAVRDRDNVRGFLLGSAVNSGGRTQGFTVPSARAQTSVIRRALDRADVSAATIDFVEAHGTGTALGDPIEIRGLKNAFKVDCPKFEKASVSLGSVKGHIGHLESAAALAGVAKIIIQMEQGVLFPTLPTTKASRLINFDQTPFHLQDELADLPPARSGARHRALLSSFGAGGVNACIVIESADTVRPDAELPLAGLFVLSARSEEVLRVMAFNLHDWLEKVGTTMCPRRIAHTLQSGRTAYSHRLAILADDLASLVSSLARYIAGEDDEGTFVGARVETLSETFASPHAQSNLLANLISEGSDRELAALWVNGVDLDWSAGRERKDLPVVLPLPGYPFVGDTYFLEEAATTAREAPDTFTGRAYQPAFTDQVIFNTVLNNEVMPTLSGHRIFERVVVPGSYFVAFAASAGHDLLGRHGFELRDCAFLEGLICDPDQSHEIQCLIGEAGPEGNRTLRIASREKDGDWRLHFRALVSPQSASAPSPARDLIVEAQSVSPDEFYERGLKLGFCWTGAFRAIQRLERGVDEAAAVIECPGDTDADAPSAIVHPAALDAAFQVALATVDSELAELGKTFMPIEIDRVRIHDGASSKIRSHFTALPGDGARSFKFDGRIDNADGTCAIEFEGFTALQVDASAIDRLENRGSAKPLKLDVLRPQWLAAEQEPQNGQQPVRVYPLNESNFLTSLEERGAIYSGVLSEKRDDQSTDLLLTLSGDDSEETATARISRAASDLVEKVRRLLDENATARLWLVSDVGSSSIDSAAMAGLFRSLAWEFPDLHATSVELLEPLNDQNASILANLIREAPDEDQWRISGGKVSALRLESVPELSTERLSALAGSQCVVAGGSGGIGALHVEWLLNQGVERVLVLGRSAVENDLPQALARLDQIWPGKLVYHIADIAELQQVEAAFINGLASDLPLAAVIHAAGTTDDGSFLNLDRQRFEKVLRAKLDGLANLAVMSSRTAERYIVLSSATGLLGAPGQANYAAANAALDSMCVHLRSEGHAILNVSWGPWKETGMTARMEQGGATSGATLGFDPQDSQTVFTRLYANEDDQYVALPWGWRGLAAHSGLQRLPSIWRSTRDHVKSDSTTAFTPPISQVAHETDPQKAIAAALHTVLGYQDAESFDWNASFADLGVDSLSSVALRDYLCAATGAKLNAAVIFDFPTPTSLVKHLRVVMRSSATSRSIQVDANPISMNGFSDSEISDQLAQELNDLPLSVRERAT